MMKSSTARSISVSLLLPLAFAVGCGSTSSVVQSSSVTAGPKPTQAVWAAAWGNAPENALQTDINPGGSEQSFRMVFRPTLSGPQERLHFSNFFGAAPVTIGAARVAVSPNGTAAID